MPGEWLTLGTDSEDNDDEGSGDDGGSCAGARAMDEEPVLPAANPSSSPPPLVSCGGTHANTAAAATTACATTRDTSTEPSPSSSPPPLVSCGGTHANAAAAATTACATTRDTSMESSPSSSPPPLVSYGSTHANAAAAASTACATTRDASTESSPSSSPPPLASCGSTRANTAAAASTACAMTRDASTESSPPSSPPPLASWGGTHANAAAAASTACATTRDASTESSPSSSPPPLASCGSTRANTAAAATTACATTRDASMESSSSTCSPATLPSSGDSALGKEASRGAIPAGRRVSSAAHASGVSCEDAIVLETSDEEEVDGSGEEVEVVHGHKRQKTEMPRQLLDLCYMLKSSRCHFCQKEQLLEALSTPGGKEWYLRASRATQWPEGRLPDALRTLLEGGVAVKLDREQAAAVWSVGEIEARLAARKCQTSTLASFSTLHSLIAGSSSSFNSGPGVPGNGKLPDQEPGINKKWTAEEWFKLSQGKAYVSQLKHWTGAPRDQRAPQPPYLPKLLHVELNPHGNTTQFAKLVQLPECLSENWLTSVKGRRTIKDKAAHLLLQLVHAHHQTYYHRDNGGYDTWFKLLIGGPVHVVCWSLPDAIDHDMHDGTQDAHCKAYGAQWETRLDIAKLMQMPSARIFSMNVGDVVLMPAGTFHYVYTERARVILAGDYLDSSCWESRLCSVDRDRLVDQDDETNGRDSLEALRHLFTQET